MIANGFIEIISSTTKKPVLIKKEHILFLKPIYDDCYNHKENKWEYIEKSVLITLLHDYEFYSEQSYEELLELLK